ncbi:MAG: ferredoxin [Candidatus Methanomethylicota archaeon]|uniref:Ferredoxin n=1 Tax=Thermoproteota archaeon TaxID=2056631 RepID=A0A497ENW2_9CREN|nr:MAG: ferredoxin [Candidatus Verstraetearchaeota archaeon]
MTSLITFLRLLIEGSYRNIVRILFKADRATSMEIRNKVLTLSVEYPPTVIDELCLGCGACAHICPVEAITMVKLDKPVEVIEGYVKEQVPRIDPEKCIYCLNCHDYCTIFALFGEAAPIHPRHVGPAKMTLQELLKKPIKVPPEKLEEFAEIVPRELLRALEARKVGGGGGSGA